MSPSFYIYVLGFLAILQVVCCRSVFDNNGITSNEMQSILAKLVLQVQDLPTGLREEDMSEELLDLADDTQEEYIDPSDTFLEQQGLYEETEEQLFKKKPSKKNKKNKNAIYSGNTVALQTMTRNRWLSFHGSDADVPHLYGCPSLYMQKSDYTSCTGEVFQIYRLDGKGMVRSGDQVGIYNPGKKVWLGCTSRDETCFKSMCPGIPKLKTGFSDRVAWGNCLGEVFKIYSRGKKDGDIINHQDDIMLYLFNTPLYVSFYGEIIHPEGCPGFERPPEPGKYEDCSAEVFNIWKRQ